ncbi:MAG: GFA family protein [Proteobacteria bacterium]|nr:GFA family protein [Pseudomonadota bacterium]
MSETLIFEGGCQCGAVRWRASGAPIMTAICHCSMCRRAHSSPAVAWAMFSDEQVRIGGQAKSYASSGEARRGFCPHCGTQIFFTASYIPGLIDLAIGSMDQPELLAPQFHYWHARHLGWAEFADDLPRHPEFPPQG